jgi:Tfp pilus assembly protein PilN
VIKINLALRKQSFISADGKAVKGATGLLQSLPLDQLKELPLRKVLLPLVVAYFASFSLDSYKQETIAKLEKGIAKQKAEEARIQSGLGKVKAYESLKKSLDSDELVIRTKLDTVQKLMADRGFIVKMLLSTASATPKDVWLTGVKTDSSGVSIQGSSLGFNQISDFMKNLNDGQFFSSIELLNSQQAKDGSDVASFELKAKKK